MHFPFETMIVYIESVWVPAESTQTKTSIDNSVGTSWDTVNIFDWKLSVSRGKNNFKRHFSNQTANRNSASGSIDIGDLLKKKKSYPSNLVIGYMNTSSTKYNKFHEIQKNSLSA